MIKQRRITVGLLWHSVNSDNFGVGALTASQVTIVQQIAAKLGLSVEFLVIGWFDRREPYIDGQNIRVVPLSSRAFLNLRRGFYSAVKKCDLICDIGAGDSFSDIYGLKRFLFISLSKAIVVLARRPLILSPQTIGPFQSWWTNLIARGLMGRCRAVVARDDLSFEILRKLDLPTKIIEATDVAFRLPYDRPPEHGQDRGRVGLNVSGLLFNGGYTGRNMFGLRADYPELVRSLLRYFTQQPECEVHLISHVICENGGLDDDYGTAEKLADEFKNVVLAPRFCSPSEAKTYIAGMDFFCGARMHACIAAFSSGVPVVPMAYSRKFAGLFGSLGYPLVADCKAETASEILSKVVDGFERRDELRSSVRSGTETAEHKLAAYEAVLQACLVEAAEVRA